MITLEQVKLLETRVSGVLDYVAKVADENALLKGKLDSYQKRIDELEVAIGQFKAEQGKIEEGILSAIDRLNRFEDAVMAASPSGAEAPASEEPEPTVPEGVPGEPDAPPETESAEAEEAETAAGEENGELDIF
jgi:chromosome segregation ATPase